MSYSTYETEDFALPLPITQAALHTAQQFASQQPTPEKAAQVHRNTLAVWAVNDYLQLMGIDTDLLASDSWNPVARLCADIADLEVSGIGRLECRSVAAQEQACSIPLEVWQDRVGYVVVEIDDAQQEAKVLGFTQMPAVQVPLSQLRSPEDLLDRLYDLKQTATAVTSSSANLSQINLSQWLGGVFEAGWQSVEALLSPAQLAFQFRGVSDSLAEPEVQSSIRRAKVINLSSPSKAGRSNAESDCAIALIVELTPQAELTPSSETDIRLQVQPLNRTHLPAGLQLKVLDAAAAVFLEATSRDVDDYLQLEFSGQPEEVFAVQVAFCDIEVTESFVI